MARHITFKGSLAFSALAAQLFAPGSPTARSIYPFYISPLRHIPTVPGCPLWGLAPARLTNELGIPERGWHRKYGLIVRYFLPFGFERLNIADDDAIKEVTVRRPYDFIKAPNATNWMKGMLGEKGVLLVEGEVHARQRKVLAPAFSTSAIRNLEPIFFEKGLSLADLLEQRIRAAPGPSRCIEMLGWLYRATLDVIGAAAFDYNVDSLRDLEAPLRPAYLKVFAFDPMAVAVLGARLYLDVVKYLPCYINRDHESSGKVVTDIASSIVETKVDADGTAPARRDIISLIVNHNKSLPDAEGLSFEDIRDQVKTFLGAGDDTTATGVAWTIDLLSKHPDVQERPWSEILTALQSLAENDSAIDPEALAQEKVLDHLPHLTNVCQESLRFIPPIPTVIRKSTADSHLASYCVPAGTYLYITSHAINHLEHYWGEDAEQFIPDRWDRLPKQWAPNAYQTFLEGPRGCIGREFAETEMNVFLVCLLSRFRFERDEQWPDQEKRKMWRLVLRPKDGISVKMRLVKDTQAGSP